MVKMMKKDNWMILYHKMMMIVMMEKSHIISMIKGNKKNKK